MAGSEEFAVEIPLRLFFSTDEPVSIKSISSSLLAIEKLSRRFPSMLEELTGVPVSGQELRVERLESGSLIEDLIMKVFFSDPEQKEKFDKFLESGPMGTAFKVALGGVLVVMTISGAITIYNNFTGNSSPSIQANHNTIITVGAEELGISEDKLRLVLNAGMSGSHKKLVKASVDALRPIEGHTNGSVNAPGVSNSEFGFSSDIIKQVPFEADFDAHNQDFTYSNVPLEVRALDRDKTESGWWVVLPSVVGDKRLRLHFEDETLAKKLASNVNVNVDVIVTYRKDLNQGSMMAISATLKNIY